ncbi:MAG: acetyl-CoA hydrolase/transferase family protein [Chloroflexi bacterium]|nr:acetyl-CoA hydrolase/transferase family protein [Chloroflexota bacterium]
MDKKSSTDWRQRVSDKLVAPEDAMARVGPGAVVAIAPFQGTPYALCDALAQRLADVNNIHIYHPVSLFPWFDAATGEFTLHTWFAQSGERDAVNRGVVEYMPFARWESGTVPEAYAEEPDFFLVAVSPPDERGYCSFGPGVWFSPTMVRNADLVIAEVHEDFIRTGGDNSVHISQIDHFSEATSDPRRIALPRRKDEEIPIVEVICTLVASELIRDGDTLQIGVGTVSAALAPYLKDKVDLGVHTELITGGIAELACEGVISGRRKTMHPGKVVGSALAAIGRAERELIDGNPLFELYEFSYVDDLRIIMQHDDMVAINNAILVDLTGQVAAETIGTQVWTGTGGQTAFAIGSSYSRGGRSIVVLPSSHIVAGDRVSRIVPTLPDGTIVTVPRTFVDSVVTEHGIATLLGKTVRERIGELITISHPDFRADLRRESQRLYGVAV